MSHNRLTSELLEKIQITFNRWSSAAYDFVFGRGTAIAIGKVDHEKTFESNERPNRFSLETKGERIYETNHLHKQERAEVPVR